MSFDIAPLYTATLAQTGDASAPPVPGAGGLPTTQTTAPGGAPIPTGGAPQGPLGGGNMIWLIVLFMVVVLVMTSMSGRKQEKQRKAMLSTLKRGDRVQTAGGIIGTVVDLSDQEMTLRVDDASNTRIRFARSAAQQILREGKETASVEAKPRSEPAAAK